MGEVVDSKPIAGNIRSSVSELVSRSREMGIDPLIAILRIGKDPASEFYFRAKIKRAADFSVQSRAITMSESSFAEEVHEVIDNLASDPSVHGIIVEAPVPSHLSYKEIVNRIPWYKDIDGATYANLGKLMSGDDCVVAATPLAVMRYIEYLKLERGSQVAVINRTITVGRPLSQLLLNSDYTPVVCHSKTADIRSICRASDAVVVAAGQPRFLNGEFVSKKSVVIDVGINSVEGKIVGDADFDAIWEKVRCITPVPGGVGSLTSLIIFENLMRAIEFQHGANIQGHS